MFSDMIRHNEGSSAGGSVGGGSETGRDMAPVAGVVLETAAVVFPFAGAAVPLRETGATTGADANAPRLSAGASEHPRAISATRLDATLTSRNVIVILGTSADRIAKLPDPSQPPRAQGGHTAGARPARFL
jgi:hypothetical protein